MRPTDRLMLKQALEKNGKESFFVDFFVWCDNNLVYRLPASGWIIGSRNTCVSLTFEELFSKFEEWRSCLLTGIL